MAEDDPIQPAPIWDLAPTIAAYKGIRVDGTELKKVYGFKDHWGRLHCKPWYSEDDAQVAADAQKAVDEGII
ncbi:MAG: hypothetical protein Kow0074_07590 [Candidatus Zixiibacteriota bacterium]